jgi:hypothetical protein
MRAIRHPISLPSANFAIEPLTAEFVEALNYAQRVYDFVLMPSPGWRSG